MRASLDHWPEKFRAVFAVMADAPPGGILFHCAAGRDRTGLISALLLQLADVPIQSVLDDYALGIHAWRDWDLMQPTPHPTTTVDENTFQAKLDQTVGRMQTVLNTLDVSDYLLRVGVTARQIASLVNRLTAP